MQRRLVMGAIVAGATIFSSVGLFFAGCGSTPPVGAGGNNGGPGAGGVVINTSPTGQGSSTGAGGSGSTGPAPTGDANCGTQTSSTSQEPADVLLVLDRSGSMERSIADDCYCSGNNDVCPDTASCTVRWPALTSAVTTTLASTPGIRWGLEFFPSPGGGNCTVNSAVQVPIENGSASRIQTEITGASPGGYTPTASAIKTATAYLKTLTDQNNKVILLATDGEPNCKGGNNTNPDVPGTVDAIAAALAAGFKVYVIGIGPSVGNLDNFAQAGGTTKSFPATSAQDLANALAAISKSVTTCTFTLAQVPPDVNNIAVYVDKNLVPKDATNGWSLGANSQTVELNGSTCAKITSGAATQVQVLFGCPGVAPPLFIP